MSTFEAWQTEELSPPRLQQGHVATLIREFAKAKDATTERAKEAVKARFALDAPSDGLGFLGNERALEKYETESEATYRSRLKRAWETWEFAGTARGIVSALNAAGFEHVSVINTFSVRPDWWDGGYPSMGAEHLPLAEWSRFWVVLEAPFPWPQDVVVRRWGDPGTYGAWGARGVDGSYLTWGSTVTYNQVRNVRSIIRKWRAAHERCAAIIVRVPRPPLTPINLVWQGET